MLWFSKFNHHSSIVVKLQGGLGNQLFQFALGYSLSQKNGRTLKLDLSRLIKDNKREYLLDVLAKPPHTVIRSTRTNFLQKLKQRANSRHSITNPSVSVIKEKEFGYINIADNVNDNTELDGYWQSWRYFEDFKNALRERLTPNKFLLSSCKDTQHLISSTKNTVSIHVRRGDYANEPHTNKFHGMCSLEYYLRAMELIERKVDDPTFFMFSDDPDWIKNNLMNKKNTIIVDQHRDQHPMIDMWLMSRCDNHIIANSTFSWWGAWLNPSPDKVIIAPKKWFNDPTIDTSDLIPKSWIRI